MRQCHKNIAMLRKITAIVFALVPYLGLYAQQHISFADPEHWTTSELNKYKGQTVVFDQPVYTCNNYSGLTASLHRVMSPTNQYEPTTAEYNTLVTVNNNSTFYLNGLTGYHRMGETIYGLKATINSATSLTYISSDAIVGTRLDTEAGYPTVDIARDSTNTVAVHNLLVCAANLEYYLVENLGTGYGADNASELQKQHTKIMAALSKIRADIYGFVEIEQGQAALQKLATALTQSTGRHYTYINDGGSSNGSYTKSGYVYCSDAVTPYGSLKNNNVRLTNRKKMQAFTHNATGERFIFSLNHFKAKSGGNANGDPQGAYNSDRVQEAQSVLDEYRNNSNYYDDDDILIMGDLNAYAKEDPILTLLRGGMTDLHRYFHADSSYSYTYHGQAGYLDHALCNNTMLQQVTGMSVWHVNSDESDNYTYDKSNDLTMFRYSDHDPVLVGLRLGSRLTVSDNETPEKGAVVSWKGGRLRIQNAEGGWYRMTSPWGQVLVSGKIDSDDYTTSETLPTGLYILNVYANGKVERMKQYVVE